MGILSFGGFTPRVLLFLAALAPLAACHLVDQRDFDASAGVRPVPKSVATPIMPVPPLVRIVFADPPPAYGAALAASVRRALAVKPDVLFLIETACASAARSDSCLAASADVARTVAAAGAARGQIEQSLTIEPGRIVPEIRVWVR
jgi:hypothetical protein